MRIRKPRLGITKRGVKAQAPSVRIGKRVGVNITKSGVSGSIRTGHGRFNTQRGLTLGGRRRGKSTATAGRRGCLFVLATGLMLTLLTVAMLTSQGEM